MNEPLTVEEIKQMEVRKHLDEYLAIDSARAAKASRDEENK